MADTDLQAFQWRPVAMSGFGKEATVVFVLTDGKAFVPVAHVSKVLGISASSATELLRRDGEYDVLDLPVLTKGGKQTMPCLWSKDAAAWVVRIDPRRVGAEAREHLREFQRKIIDTA